MTRKLISVIGSGNIEDNSEEYNIAFQIGKSLIDNRYRLVTGGLGGIMEAASKGARNSTNYHEGDIVGILRDIDPSKANKYVDIPIATGLGINRNIIVANSEAVISIGGGSGTLSEMAFAWQLNKLVLAWKHGLGWSHQLANKSIDDRRKDIVFGFDNVKEAISILKNNLQ